MNIIIFIDRELNESYDFSSLKSLKNNFIEKIYFSGNKDLLKNISMLIQNKKNKYNLIFLVIKKVFLKEIKIEQYKLLKLIRNRLSVKQNNLLDCLLDGKGIKEISEEWGARYGTIQTLKSRLLKKMREVLLQIKLNQKYDYSS